MSQSMRVCVIGAGPAGMSTLYHFAKLPKMQEVVCYEKQDTWGGLWNFTWRTGVDQYGEPCHSGMYKRLLTNGPKECLEFTDYTFNEHFGKDIGTSFPRREVVLDFMAGRWTNKAGRDLKRLIKFSTVVRSVVYTEKTESFTVIVNDLKTGTISSEQFTHVVIAGGIFNQPNAPAFPGIECFDGRVVHSHDFKDGLEFKNQDVLLIGSSFSAEDIALHIMSSGGKSVIVSWQTNAPNHNWPNGITEKCSVRNFKGQTVQFTDGSSAAVDSIILCTGYKALFPFLEGRLRIEEKTSFYQSQLYKGSLFIPLAQSKLFFIGAQEQLFTVTLIDCIAAWTARFIMGLLPNEPKTTKEMQNYGDYWHGRAKQLKSIPEIAAFQASLIENLAGDTKYGMEYVQAVSLFVEWDKDRKAAIAHFREHKFASFLSK
ncbi:GSOX1-like protein [Mya arenaria]|uniref:Flavin-containing monooxygenase n=1 Tax=Mya arenaria TaxID=6604 RepID=A0ABY7EHC7_MYAAR|nr:uncharacterized protein LOC128237809 [Mya arenaria]WAR08277.1 GSOX1-like protein [Mya arenaria]